MTALGNTQLPKATLITLIQTITGIQTRWRKDPEFVAGIAPGTTSMHAWIWLHIASQRAIGQDDYRQQLNPTTGNLDSQVSGNRIFTLSCRCESYDKNIETYDLVETIRIRLRTFQARSIFVPAGLALVDIGPSTSFQGVSTAAGTKRTLKVSVIDVRFAYVSTYTPLPADDPGTTIATVDSNKLGQLPPSTLVP